VLQGIRDLRDPIERWLILEDRGILLRVQDGIYIAREVIRVLGEAVQRIAYSGLPAAVTLEQLVIFQERRVQPKPLEFTNSHA